MDGHDQPAASGQKPKLLDQVRNTCRLRHYSIRTEQAHVHWAKKFILYHGKRHPATMAKAEVEAFLTHLAVEGRRRSAGRNRIAEQFCVTFVSSCRECGVDHGARYEKRATPQVLRHSFATHLLESVSVIGTVRELLDHNNVTTTQIQTGC